MSGYNLRYLEFKNLVADSRTEGIKFPWLQLPETYEVLFVGEPKFIPGPLSVDVLPRPSYELIEQFSSSVFVQLTQALCCQYCTVSSLPSLSAKVDNRINAF